MSLSKTERQANIDIALKLQMEEVGERSIRQVFIDPTSDAYRDIHETTWIELQHRGVIRRSVLQYFSLSGYGWRTALELTEQNNNYDTRVKLGRMCSSLKAAVKGRSNPAGVALVSAQDVAVETGLELGFVANVIDGELIDYWLKRHGAIWADGWEGQMLAVPLDFGLEKL